MLYPFGKISHGNKFSPYINLDNICPGAFSASRGCIRGVSSFYASINYGLYDIYAYIFYGFQSEADLIFVIIRIFDQGKLSKAFVNIRRQNQYAHPAAFYNYF